MLNPVIQAAQRRTSLIVLAVQLQAGHITQEEHDKRVAEKEAVQ